MRITVVTTSWPASESDPSGHFVRAEVRGMQRAGHTVRVMAPPPGGAFGWPGAAARLRERPWLAWDAARWVLEARAEVAHLAADRIVAHWVIPSALPVCLPSSRAELHLVSHGADVRLLVSLPRALRLHLVGALAARAALWRFASDSLREELCRTLDAPRTRALDRIAVVQAPPVEMPDVTVPSAALRATLRGKRVAVAVGRLVPSKRVDRIIEHVASGCGVDALVVVGDGPERASLEHLARERRIDARFVGLLGRPEALAWIGAADVLLLASRAEGLSTVVREAESLRTPVRTVA